jgi:uncharacterized protein YbbK (DUF523 family)
MKLVSACLAGIPCRYDGTSCLCAKAKGMVDRGEAIPVCPEQLAGLPTPRPSAENAGDRIITIDGQDVTSDYLKGAEEVLKIAESNGCREAILKSKSPSCGFGKVFDGTFSGTLKDGDGITAALLKRHGVSVVTEMEEFDV